jgi:hypothetical protein
MKKLVAALALLALAIPAHAARKVGGVEFQDTIDVDGTKLALNGAGLRKRFVVKVYAGGLYLAEPSKDANAVVASDTPKRVRMVFLRGVSRDQVMGAYREGFEKNSGGANLAALLQKLEQVGPAIPGELREGSEMFVTYVPGKGTTIAAAGGGKPVTVEGKDFADAIFRNWLGPQPADENLKSAMLGR